MGERLEDGEEDDEDRAGGGDRTHDHQEVAARHIAPPLLVEPEGREDGHLPHSDENDGLQEEHLVAVREAARVVEEAKSECQVEGEGDEQRVGNHLEDPIAVDGMVQAAHEADRV